MSTTVGWPRADQRGMKEHHWPFHTTGQNFLWACLYTLLARAMVQLAPYGSGWPLQGLPHFEHPGTCLRGVNDTDSMFGG